MDRSNFINRSYLNNTGSCGQDDCECINESFETKKEWKKINPLHLLAITVLAFVCAVAFSWIKNDATPAGMLRDKRTKSIACGPAKINYTLSIDHRQPADRNNGNNCPHQLGASCFLYANDSKRKKNHIC